MLMILARLFDLIFINTKISLVKGRFEILIRPFSFCLLLYSFGNFIGYNAES